MNLFRNQKIHNEFIDNNVCKSIYIFNLMIFNEFVYNKLKTNIFSIWMKLFGKIEEEETKKKKKKKLMFETQTSYMRMVGHSNYLKRQPFKLWNKILQK